MPDISVMNMGTVNHISSFLKNQFRRNTESVKKDSVVREGSSLTSAQLAASNQRQLLKRIEFDPPKRTGNQSGSVISCGKAPVVILNEELKLSTDRKDVNHPVTHSQMPKPKVVLFPRSEVVVGYTAKRGYGSGMMNVGNTCYLNSTLQALFHTPSLVNYLLRNDCKCRSSPNGSWCAICALLLTLKDSSNGSAIRPHRVYDRLKSICKTMVFGRQEDAHEFLRYLIEALQKSYLATNIRSCFKPSSLDTLSRESTPFNQIFGGYMLQDIVCMKCKYVSRTRQHFLDLNLDIKEVNTIDQAMKGYFKHEIISHHTTYKCEKCKINVTARRRCLIDRAPIVLCLQLKRFSINGGKIGKPIQLSLLLDATEYIRGAGKAGLSIKYKLVSMITHVGPSVNCGHYTAIGETGNGQFYLFDDSSVRPIPTGQALNTASYIIFYELTPACKISLLQWEGSDYHVANQSELSKQVPYGPHPSLSHTNLVASYESSEDEGECADVDTTTIGVKRKQSCQELKNDQKHHKGDNGATTDAVVNQLTAQPSRVTKWNGELLKHSSDSGASATDSGYSQLEEDEEMDRGKLKKVRNKKQDSQHPSGVSTNQLFQQRQNGEWRHPQASTMGREKWERQYNRWKHHRPGNRGGSFKNRNFYSRNQRRQFKWRS